MISIEYLVGSCFHLERIDRHMRYLIPPQLKQIFRSLSIIIDSGTCTCHNGYAVTRNLVLCTGLMMITGHILDLLSHLL